MRLSRAGWIRLVLLGLSVLMCWLLWRNTKWGELWERCKTLNLWWLGAALFLVLLQNSLAGARWAWTVGAYQPMGIWRGTELVYASVALNLVLPMKAGDVVKGIFLRPDLPGGDATTGITLGVFDKVTVLAALAAVELVATAWAWPVNTLEWLMTACAAGVVGAYSLLLCKPVAARVAVWDRDGANKIAKTGARAAKVILHLRTQPARLAVLLAGAVVFWILEIAQFSILQHAAGEPALGHFAMIWSRVPMATLVGTLPISFAGIGTRDLTFVYLLGGTVGDLQAKLMGMYATLKYVMSAALGVPFVMRLPIDRSLLAKRKA